MTIIKWSCNKKDQVKNGCGDLSLIYKQDLRPIMKYDDDGYNFCEKFSALYKKKDIGDWFDMDQYNHHNRIGKYGGERFTFRTSNNQDCYLPISDVRGNMKKHKTILINDFVPYDVRKHSSLFGKNSLSIISKDYMKALTRRKEVSGN